MSTQSFALQSMPIFKRLSSIPEEEFQRMRERRRTLDNEHNNFKEIDINANDKRQEGNVALVWRGLSYTLPPKSVIIPSDCMSGPSNTRQDILLNMNGQIRSGTMTALMGPSGSGKSTLLNCISNKLQNGLTGDVFFRINEGYDTKVEDIRIGFVPQQDHLFMQFTVRETLMFASRMNNPGYSMKQHKEIVNKCMDSLDLTIVADTGVWKLSGGQVKRTSIACELISQPKILILDEPTTGLDSDNSENVIILLKQLLKPGPTDPPAIIATIHQPSSDVFMMFDSIYMLNRIGSNSYSGPPQDCIAFLESFAFERKEDVNPADYMIEVLNGKYGTAKFVEMSDYTRGVTLKAIEEKTGNDKRVIEVPISSVKQTISGNVFIQLWLLFWRGFLGYMTKTPIVFFKITLGIAAGMVLVYLPKHKPGLVDGCWTSMLKLPSRENMTIEEEKNALKDFMFDNFAAQARGTNNVNINFIDDIARLGEASVFLGMLIMFQVVFYGMSGVLIFPSEFKVVQKEITNNWYSVPTYFFSRVICDGALMVVTVFPMVTACHYAAEYPTGITDKSFWMLMLCLFMEALLWESRAQFFSILFHKNLLNAIVCTLGITFPNAFLSGLFVAVEDLKDYLQPLTVTSDMRYAFELVYVTTFGFDRCSSGKVISGLTSNVLKNSTIQDLGTNVWHIMSFNEKDGSRLSRILNLTEKDYLTPVIEGINDYLGPPPEAGPDAEYDVTFQSYQKSYMLSVVNFSEDNFSFDLWYLLLITLATKIAVFFVLLAKAKVKRL